MSKNNENQCSVPIDLSLYKLKSWTNTENHILVNSNMHHIEACYSIQSTNFNTAKKHLKINASIVISFDKKPYVKLLRKS